MERNKILIVDDNPKNIQVLANTLGDAKYEIEYTTNGYDAIEWLNKDSFDLILLDVMMPEMDGYEICSKIKENEAFKDLPIIFITAKTDVESIVKGFDYGAVDYITKPFNSKELLARVNTHLELQNSKKKINDLYKDLKHSNDNLLSSINYARNIQRSSLPSDQQLNTIIPNNFLLFRPQAIIGGDFYWIKERHNKIYLVVGDCTGHGIPGAMLTMLVINSLNNIHFNYLDLQASEILELLKKEIIRFTSANENFSNDSVDLSLCIIDKNLNKMQFSGANSQIIIAKKGVESTENIEINKTESKFNFKNPKVTVDLIKGIKNTVGYNLQHQDFVNLEINLNSDDKIYLFSDGLQDQFGGPKEKKFKQNQLINLIAKSYNYSFPKQNKIFEKALDQWQGNLDQVDDITLLGFSLPENIGVKNM
ncbi:MAG: response regulator [Bacteroidales bacterium]|jgi:sigma-B regulation protein RsbU (phosphoserine phosphatase)|nr:response regulator [Bacteroidales bacterium]